MRYNNGKPLLMIYAFGDDIPSLSAWIKKHSFKRTSVFLEAPTGFEPVITILQTVALPLGYGADFKEKNRYSLEYLFSLFDGAGYEI